MRFRIAASLALLFLLCPSPAAGQASSTATGIVTGQVTDATGAVLAGVAATLTSPALMGPRTALTTQAGAYRFIALPPGTYALTLTRDGFAPATRDDIYVAAGFTATIDVTMGLKVFTEDARVSGSTAVLDRRATSLATTFNAAQLASLPGSRSMGAVLSSAPAVYVSRFDVGGSSIDTGSYGAYGTSGLNRPMVEGLSVSGIMTTGLSLDFGSFEEISVGTGAHGPEWHSPGVQMQFISKSGGNQYRGSIFADYGTRQWQSFNIDDEQTRFDGGGSGPPRDANRLWSYYDVNADVGGYIKPDTLWWDLRSATRTSPRGR